MPPKRATRRSGRVARAPPKQSSGPTDDILHETFGLFAVPRQSVPRLDDTEGSDDDDDADPEELVLKIADVRRALAAVDIGRPPADFFEPGERSIGREHFMMLARTLAEADGDDEDASNENGDSDGDDAYRDDAIGEQGGGFVVEDDFDGQAQSGDEEDESMAGGFERPKTNLKAKGKARASADEKPAPKKRRKGRVGRVVVDEARHRQEVDHAFKLFTHNRQPMSQQGEVRITLADLRRIARELREDVDDATLRKMLAEASGDEGISKGVGRDEFEAVMRRAGIV